MFASSFMPEGLGALWTALGRASLDGAIFIALVWSVCLLFPRMPASFRSGLWWLAGLKLLVGFLWVTPLALPILPPRQAAVVDAGPEIAMPAVVAGAELPLMATPQAEPMPRPLPWREGLVLVWMVGVGALALRAARDLHRVRKICERAEPVSDPHIGGIFGGLARQFGIRGAELRMSKEIEGPHVLGLSRPVVVLPHRDIGRLSDSEWEMILAHELMHLRRGDLRFGWIPFMAQRLFFFHPLVTLAVREYQLAREAACDAAAVQALNASPRSYGQLLLSLSAPGREIGAAAIGASSAHRVLKRRLGMLAHATDSKRFPRGLRWLVAVVALAGLVPIQLAARSVDATPEKADTIVAPVESSEPTLADILVSADTPRTDSGTPVAVSDDLIEKTSSTPQPATAATPVADEDVDADVDPEVEEEPQTEWIWSWDEDHEHGHENEWSGSISGDLNRHVRDGDFYLLMQKNGSAFVRGTTDDLRFAKKLRQRERGEFLLFRRNGKTYILRDRGLIAEANRAFEPQRVLGRQQAKLGNEQGRLGAQQGRLGSMQGALGAEHGELGAVQAEVAMVQAEIASLRAAGRLSREEHRELMDRTRELSARIRSLSADQHELGKRQRELGARQAELGQRQAALGAKQGELGRRQAEATQKARAQLKRIIRRAMDDGKAEVVPR